MHRKEVTWRKKISIELKMGSGGPEWTGLDWRETKVKAVGIYVESTSSLRGTKPRGIQYGVCPWGSLPAFSHVFCIIDSQLNINSSPHNIKKLKKKDISHRKFQFYFFFGHFLLQPLDQLA